MRRQIHKFELDLEYRFGNHLRGYFCPQVLPFIYLDFVLSNILRYICFHGSLFIPQYLLQVACITQQNLTGRRMQRTDKDQIWGLRFLSKVPGRREALLRGD